MLAVRKQKKSASTKPAPNKGGSSKKLAKLKFEKDGYAVVDTSEMPMELKSIPCCRLFIEFLRVTNSQRPSPKNHCVFKVDFAADYDEYKGVRISMEPNWDLASDNDYRQGRLLVKPVPYARQSNSTARSIELALRQTGTRLYDLLFAFMSCGVHMFSSSRLNRDTMAAATSCRTQALYAMSKKGLVGLDIISTTPDDPMLPVATAYLALGMRFRAHGRGSACPIDRGEFDGYERTEEGEMQYVGSEAARLLAEYLAPGAEGGQAE